jgi:O-antigen/teichoic acid export membrane protein
LRSVFLALLVLASAYPMAHFYSQPKLLTLIPALSVAALIDGFQNVGLAILRKQISFARIFWYERTVNIAATCAQHSRDYLAQNQRQKPIWRSSIVTLRPSLD